MVTALDVSEEVLSCFWDLASIDASQRVDAATRLINHLKTSQQEHGVGSDEAQEAADDKTSAVDKAVAHCSPLVAYAVKRLYKGLTSSREGARQGFALALSAALRQLDCFLHDDVLALLESFQDMTHGGSRDEFFGQLFGLGAVVRGRELDTAMATSVVEQAVALAHKKSFLREAAAMVILEVAESNNGVMEEVLTGAQQLRAWLTVPFAQSSPEVLMLALRLWRFMPAELRKACGLLPACSAAPSAQVFTQGRNSKDKGNTAVAAALFSENHLDKVAPLLRPTTQGHPRLHTVWPTLLALLLPGYSAEAAAGQEAQHSPGAAVPELEAFWRVLVEEDIFESASQERKYLGFTLFTATISLVAPQSASDLLSPNFLRALASNAAKKASPLHAVAQLCMEKLQATVQRADAGSRAKMLLALERHGGILAKLSRTQKGAENSSADADSRVAQLKEEYNALAEGGAVDAANRGRQKWVLGQLVAIAKGRQGGGGSAVAEDVLGFLLEKGAFLEAGGGSSSDADSLELQTHCASLLVSTLDAVSRAKLTAKPELQQGRSPLVAFTAQVEESVASGVQLAQEPTDESKMACDTLSTLRQALERVAGGKQPSEAHKQAEALLYLASLLELHSFLHPAAADPALAVDLAHVASEVFEDDLGEVAGGGGGGGGGEGEEAVHWADAMVDIVLSILSRNEAPLPSAPLRDAAERLFKVFAGHVTATGLQDLLEVILKPLNEVGEGDDEEEGESDDEEEGKEGGSEGEGESEEESEVEEEEADGIDEENERDSDEDEGVTDEHMFRMDAQLGAYFTSMQKGKDSKRVHQDMVGFKLRALACLEALMKKAPGSPLLIDLAAPLLESLASARKASGDLGLAERLAGLLRNQLSRCKPEVGDLELEDDDFGAQLRRALYLASRSEDKVTQEGACSALAFLLRIGFACAPAAAAESLSAALDDYFDKKKTRLHRPFFEQLLRRVPAAASASLPSVLEACASGRNDYTRQEAFALLEVAAKAADEGEMLVALNANAAAFGAALLTAVTEPFAKKRRTEVLKAVCGVLSQLQEGGKGLIAGLLDAETAKQVSDALAAALEANSTDSQLTRLAGLLDAFPAKQEGKKPVAVATAGKKRAVAAAPKSTPPPTKKKSLSKK